MIRYLKADRPVSPTAADPACRPAVATEYPLGGKQTSLADRRMQGATVRYQRPARSLILKLWSAIAARTLNIPNRSNIASMRGSGCE